jgi:hypothetical protein
MDRLADDGIVAGPLRRCGGCDVSFQQAGISTCDFPERGALAVRSSDDAGLGLQIFGTDAEPPRRRRNKNAARFRACRPDGAPTLLDRLTAKGVLLVRPLRSIGANHSDLLKPDVEFFRRNLRQCGEDTLTKLGLPGENRHRFVRLQSNPPLQFLVVAQTERQRSRRLVKRRTGRQGE